MTKLALSAGYNSDEALSRPRRSGKARCSRGCSFVVALIGPYQWLGSTDPIEDQSFTDVTAYWTQSMIHHQEQRDTLISASESDGRGDNVGQFAEYYPSWTYLVKTTHHV
jgi:hypothetical protein